MNFHHYFLYSFVSQLQILLLNIPTLTK
jgi:hypothetical protein